MRAGRSARPLFALAAGLLDRAQPNVGWVEDLLWYDGMVALLNAGCHYGGDIDLDLPVFDGMIRITAGFRQIAHRVRIMCITRCACVRSWDAQDARDECGMTFAREVDISACERRLR